MKVVDGFLGGRNLDWALGNDPTWMFPFSSHVKSSGELRGGNFLFEDGRVTWYDSSELTLAATADNWVFYYQVTP